MHHLDINPSFLYEHSSLSRELDNYNYEYLASVVMALGAIQDHYKQADDTPLNGVTAFQLIILKNSTMGIAWGE